MFVFTSWQSWWGKPGWDRFVHVVAAVTFAGAIGGFAKIAHEVAEGDHIDFENRIMHAMRESGQPLGPSWVPSFIRDVTSLGSAAVLVMMTVMILGYLLLSGQRRIALLIAVAIGGGEVVNTVLKNAFDRARPDATLHLVGVHSTSFPSGHAMAASIFYLTMGVILARTAKRRREKTYFISWAIFLTLLVAFSRVYLGVHYPTDVLAGWAAGTAWALLCWFVADWLARRGALRADVEKA
jgi:undecaprenyl-diphosphatase